MLKNVLGELSIREKNLWVELLVDVIVALYYYPKMFLLITAGDAALTGERMVNLIISTVMLAIFVAVALAALLHEKQQPEPKDERDLVIDNRGSVLFGRMLLACVLFIMGMIVMQEMSIGRQLEWLIALSPLVIAHLLLFTLMISSTTSSVLKLVLYRRGL
jgi:hypothetical protein